MNLQQLSQELVQRKEEFTQLKEKINQVCQTLLEKVEKDLTPEEEELVDMLMDGLINVPPDNEISEYENIEKLNLRLENNLQDEYEKIEQKHTDLGENVNEIIDILYVNYKMMFCMYVGFVRAMEAERQRQR